MQQLSSETVHDTVYEAVRAELLDQWPAGGSILAAITEAVIEAMPTPTAILRAIEAGVRSAMIDK